MRTVNTMFQPKTQNPVKNPNFKPSTENSFREVFGSKISQKEPSTLRNEENGRKDRDRNVQSHNSDARDQKKSEEKSEKQRAAEKLKELKTLLTSEGIKDMENSEELEALGELEELLELHELLKSLAELSEEVQLILEGLMQQELLGEALTEKIEALMDLDISMESLSGEEAKTLENLSKLLQGLEEISEKIAVKVQDPKELEKLLKVQEEMKALVDQAMKKAGRIEAAGDQKSSKNPEISLLNNQDSDKEEKAEQTSGEKVKSQEEKEGREKAVSNSNKEKESSLMKKSAGEEKTSGKEEKNLKASVTLDTKEEQPLERNFLFSQDKVESFDKLSSIIPKNSTGLEQNLSQMIEEMTEKISIMKNGEASEIKMQLVPNNLGKLVIQLFTDENILSARVYADTPKVKEMIENQLQDLKEALIDKGLTVESLEVFVGQEKDRALYQKHGPMMMAGRNKSSQISFGEMEALEEAALNTNPYVEKYQYNRLV
ncbi:flagellar hook-length control protein FliK [Isachenkonia alkalipeptolytica]|uniref:Flagellar hook-length control protein-like C-terminal domain-containing protein n=1 Tax=Isachenkonia alkalipeptolytica TaxID=2565777 RepID=A0AA44BD58_9CLOT|nr:flagellar hook-length control protein FliK [Isachenkonia alkalipeptolytica]NBG87568.1 hypothetical protein [Isachenkonia alkalipeptolytica]